jgi:hypothetical protein
MSCFISSPTNVPLVHPAVVGKYLDREFYNGFAKKSKLGSHIMINMDERPFLIIWKIIMHWISMLTLEDHVMHDYTSIHDLPHLSSRLLERRVLDNSKEMLGHTKGSLNILPTTLLALGKPCLFSK